MRLLLATIVALASVNVLIGQVTVMVSDVAKRIRTVSDPGYTVSIYEYEGVSVVGELSLADFGDALGLVKPQLDASERIMEVRVSAQAYAPRSRPREEIRVLTCTAGCDAGRFGRRAGGGRGFLLERKAGKLQVFSVLDWIS